MRLILLTLFTMACSTEPERDDDDDEGWVEDDGWDNQGGSTQGGGSDGYGSGSGGASGGGTGGSGGGETGGSTGEGDDWGGDDWGGDDGDVMNSAPGCLAAGALCYSYVGPLWPGYESSHCDQISASVQAEGGPALEYTATGCPSGASSECSGILGLMDSDENLLDGSEYSIYFYGGTDASAECGQAGGTYTTL